eukprot:c13177_g2_i1.p1 GENE.c13177_g2_i1~~c13177_g2_i1.p1  ORF type:complete len:237 (+),score=71.56 c13177_g2_i1:123-833(+)
MRTAQSPLIASTMSLNNIQSQCNSLVRQMQTLCAVEVEPNVNASHCANLNVSVNVNQTSLVVAGIVGVTGVAGVADVAGVSCVNRVPHFVEVSEGVQVMESSNGVNITKDNTDLSDRFAFNEVICGSGDVVRWKVDIVTNGSIFAGIISTNSEGNNSYRSATSFGWSGSPLHNGCRCSIDGSRYYKGSAECGDWGGWITCDEAIVKLDCVNNMLSMKHIRSNTVTVRTMTITPHFS